MRMFLGMVLAGGMAFLVWPLSLQGGIEGRTEAVEINDRRTLSPLTPVERRAEVISRSFGLPHSEALSYAFTAYQVCLEEGFDVDSLLALVAVETGFRNLVSSKQAKGHTQIRMVFHAHLFPRYQEVWNPYWAYKACICILREYRGSLKKYSGGAKGYEKKFRYWYNRFKSSLIEEEPSTSPLPNNRAS